MARQPTRAPKKDAQQALRGPSAATEAAPPPSGIIATTGDGRDITEFFLETLRPLRDAILVARGAGLELYEEVKRDDRVFTALQQRRLGLVSKPWDVEPGDDSPASIAAAEALKADLERIGWDAICEKMHWGVFWGYAVGECIWEARTDSHGTRWTFASIKVRKARRFRMGADNSLRLMTQTNQIEGEVMPDNKFWLYTAGEDADDYPYGLGLAHWLFWPVYFKRHGLRMWAQAVEKYASPTAVGKFPPTMSDADQRKFLAALRGVHSDSAIIAPEGADISLLEMAKAAGADQALLYAAMDRAIATIITGQSTTIEAASNRSQTDTHKDVRDELIQADNDLLCSSFQSGPLTWWTAWNFPGAAVPRVTRELEPEEDQELSTRVDTALDRMGWALTAEQVQERYGNGYERKSAPPVDVVPDPQGAAGAARSKVGAAVSFAEGDGAPKDAISLAAEEAAGEWQRGVGPMLEAVKLLAANSDNLEEMLAALPDVLDNVDMSAFERELEDATLQARVAGRVGAPLSGPEAALKQG